MPLDTAGLKSDLQSLGENATATAAAAAQAWAQVLATYASNGLVPPSTGVAAAATALQTALVSAFGTGSAAAAMESAFTAFATAVAAGMAPAFVGTPPPGQVGFASLFATTRASAAAAGEAVGGAIDTWMKTGTAVPSAGGATTNWA